MEELPKTHAAQHLLPGMGEGIKPIPISSELVKLKTKKGAIAMSSKRLKDYGTMDGEATLESLDDIKNQEVTITSVRFLEGVHGEYAVINCTDEEKNEHVVSTGAMFVMDALRGAIAEEALPVKAKFIRRARYWLVT